MIWTAAMDATLTTAWAAGMSSFQIATLMGDPITAAAVRNRRVDIGLAPRGSATLVWAGQFKTDAYRPPIRKALTVKSKLNPLAEPRPFIERQPHECAYVIGDPDDPFACCAPVPEGARRPYCKFHLKLTRLRHAA